MATQPSTFLNWTQGQPSFVVQPPTSLQATGWILAQAPPFEYMNWLFYITDQWIQYFAALSVPNPVPNMRLLTTGVFNYINSSGVLKWTSDLFIQIPGIPDNFNDLAPGTATLADGDVVYVTANIPVISVGNTVTSSNQITGLSNTQGITSGMQIFGGGFTLGTTVLSIVGSTVTASAGSLSGATNTNISFSNNTALTATVVANDLFVPTNNQFIFARRNGSSVYVGFAEGGMYLADQETEPFLGQRFPITENASALPIVVGTGTTLSNPYLTINSANWVVQTGAVLLGATYIKLLGTATLTVQGTGIVRVL